MHILHISNSYGGTAVYQNLYEQLDRLGIRQTVFVPLNASNRSRVGNQMIDFRTEKSQIIYSTALKKYHKLLYKAKIKCIVKHVCKKVDVRDIDLIHASTQCLDGAVAYELHKSYGIPYIIAVRNTDVSTYYGIFKWYIPYYSKILENAERIIFISPKYKENHLNNLVTPEVSAKIASKVMVIPNGVDHSFLGNRCAKIHHLGTPIKVVFISAFKKGKGLIELIDAVSILRDKGYDITLRAIGRGLPGRGHDANYLAAVDKRADGKDWIYLEQFKRPAELREVLRESSIFAMPSAPETFGLVYVEALTQNVPILYAKGQGFDGFYPDGFVGYPAKATDAVDVAMKLELIIAEYQVISRNIRSISLENTFDWNRIAVKYSQIYQEILS